MKALVLLPMHVAVLLLLCAAMTVLFTAWLACWVLQSFHVETSFYTNRGPLIPAITLDLSGRKR